MLAGQNAQSAGYNLNQADEAKRSTEMDKLDGLTVSNLQTLRTVNDLLESSLDRFESTGKPLTKDSQPPSLAPPVPGTLNSLVHIAQRTNEELARLSELVNRVRGIL